MKHGKRIRYGVVVSVSLVGLLLAYGSVVSSDEKTKKKSVKVIAPLDQAVMLSGSFDVICKADEPVELLIDGKPCDWAPFSSPVYVAPVRLTPGRHRLVLGEQELEVVVALNEMDHDGPLDWRFSHRHGMSADEDRCADCHEMEKKGDEFVLGEFLGYVACFECHSSIDFEVDHAHILEPLEACQMCHAVHGTTEEKSLLKAPMRQLCEECHDPDH